MRKVHLVCSLLLAFSASVFGIGCDAKKPENKMSGPAPSVEAAKPDSADAGKKATGKKPKSSGAGSTTGGGVEVPAAGGTTEKPADENAKAVEEKATEATPDAKPEEKTETKPEEKTEEKKPE